MNLILVRHGSFLYGTATPKSDTDYRGVFIPSMYDVINHPLIKQIKTTTKQDHSKKNTADDVDTDLLSLRYFLEQVVQGLPQAIETLFAPEACVVEYNDPAGIWEELKANSNKVISKNLVGFTGFCNHMRHKYGYGGSAYVKGDVDRKALAHGIRIAKQGIELLKTGKIAFPLEDAHTLLAIRNGDISLPDAQHLIEEAYKELKSWQAWSDLPNMADVEWVDDFCYWAHKEHWSKNKGA